MEPLDSRLSGSVFLALAQEPRINPRPWPLNVKFRGKEPARNPISNRNLPLKDA